MVGSNNMLIQKLDAVLSRCGDDAEKSLVYSMLENACRYVESVYSMETRAELLRFRAGPEEYRKAVESMDRHRRACHEAYMADLGAVNRLCRSKFLPELYTGPDDRAAKGDFAFVLAEAYALSGAERVSARASQTSALRLRAPALRL